MTTALSAPGESHTRTYGRITLTAQITDTGTYRIDAHLGTWRINELCTAHTDRAAARLRYRRIADLAATGATAEQVTEQVNAPADAVLTATAQIVDTAAATPVNPLTELKAAFAELRRDTRTPKTGVTAVTGPQQRVLAIAAARPSGIVNRGRGEATVTQLMALDAKGLVDLTRDNSRRGYITGAVITGAGRRHLDRIQVGVA